ncbi:MAG: dihydroorotate dehydrogenase [Pirellulaceae bacterium]|nr:MAG: dihydroorotate dehydrogenase [Pirellulaceae bacterium]
MLPLVRGKVDRMSCSRSTDLAELAGARSISVAEVPVAENEPLARDTYRLRIYHPPMARRFLPGQFLMLRLADCDDPLIGRAFALYDTVLDERGEPCGVDVVYLVKGKLTRRLARTPVGQRVLVWGPLGNSFPPIAVDEVVMVAGGIGQTPFLAWARELAGQRMFGEPPRRVPVVPRRLLLYGTRTADLLAGLEAFAQAGLEVQLATEDGSRGHAGRVTELLEKILQCGKRPAVVACGPDPMLAAVAQLCFQYEVPCWVSLETPMACGIGICFSCVARVRQDGDWDYRRTCVEGPVFDARCLVW